MALAIVLLHNLHQRIPSGSPLNLSTLLFSQLSKSFVHVSLLLMIGPPIRTTIPLPLPNKIRLKKLTLAANR